MKLQEIAGNECAKRAIEIALVGNHSISFIGNSEAELLSQTAKDLKLQAKAFKPCSCGYFGDMQKTCTCKPFQIKKAHEKMLKNQTDLTIYAVPATPERILQALQGKNEKDEAVLKRVAVAKKHEAVLDLKIVESLLSQAVKVLGLDQLQVMRVLETSKTISRLNGNQKVQLADLAEALQYRPKSL